MSKANVQSAASFEQSPQDIDQYWDDIVRYLRNRGVHKDYVEDYAQQTLMNVYVYLLKGKTLNKPLAFLYTTAANVVKQNYRDQKMAAITDAVPDCDALGHASQVPSAEERAISELEYQALCSAIGKLPDKYRKVFILRKIYQCSYEEIAEECGLSIHAVLNRAHRGLKLVHKYCKNRVGLLPH